MIKYKNLNGNSSVRYFEYGEDYITILFNSGDYYLYTINSVGWENLEAMIWHAKQGYGLSGYINRNCRNDYEDHWR